MKKNRNTSIDAMRFVCAFFVVCQHMSIYPPSLSQYISGFVRMAVPFFFMISGYHLYNSVNKDFKSNIVLTLKKVFGITLIYFTFYLVWWNFREIYYPEIFTESKFNFFGFLLLNGSVEHLWYLFAFLYALIFLYIAGLKFINIKTITALFFIYFVVALYARSLPLKDFNWWIDVNWITMGLQYLTVGMFVKKHESNFRFGKNHLIGIICISFLLIYAEHFLLKMFVGRGPSVVFVYIFSVTIFVYCINGYTILSDRFQSLVEKIGRISSLDVYIHHIWVRDIILMVGVKEFANSWVVFFVICAASYYIRTYRAK